MSEENANRLDVSENDDVSQISGSPPPPPCSSDTEQHERETENDQNLSVTNQFEENLQIDDENDDDLTVFIRKAQREGFNCLDLSKRNIEQFPKTLLDFPSLQYLYLEGNFIETLPQNIFLRLSNLKWIDLRNNKLTNLPSDGLAKHGSLRYLLLGGNLIRSLPVQLGKLKGLSALNLDGNPLDEPPAEIVKQGIKAIQQYLRNEGKTKEEDQRTDDDDEEPSIDMVADVWASSDDDGENQRRLTRSNHQNVLPRQSLTLSLQKSKKTGKKFTTNETSTGIDPIADVYAARAKEEQRLRRLKQRKIKIDEDLQKVKTREFVYEWKEDYRNAQQENRRKRLIKGKDFQETVTKAPFGIDHNYVPIMNKDQQEFLEKAIRHESRRNRSPESAMREEEERRNRDRQIQARIREITTKMMRRRNEGQPNALEEKRQSELELRELRKLEAEVKQRRTQINSRFKAYTGDVKSRKKL